MKYPTRQFVSDTRMMTAEGRWTPEAVLIYELMKRLAEIEPRPEGLVVQGARARQLIIPAPEIPADGSSLVIQVLDGERLRITTTEPEE